MKNEKKYTIDQNTVINNGLTKDSKVHINLTQEVVVTTEDKIRICLTNSLNKMGKKSSWIAPFGILLTILITLLTTNFKDFYFSADTWTAVFIIAGVLSFIWLSYCLKNIVISVDVDDVIDELKKGSPIKKEKGHVVLLDKENRIIISSDGQ